MMGKNILSYNNGDIDYTKRRTNEYTNETKEISTLHNFGVVIQ